ncbi:MAG: penicillin acylase family protein [Vicinamibacterales bacterium]
MAMMRHTEIAKRRQWLLLLSIVAACALHSHPPRSHQVAAVAVAATPDEATGTSSASAARAAALASRAVIRRDRYGVPHILAETEEAAAFAHGYVTAEDHGAALARLFLRARGKLASVFGEAFVQEDLEMRALGIREVASERITGLPPVMQAILAGYADGYNAFLATHQDEFPDWADPITGVDVLAHARAVLLGDFALNLEGWADVKGPAASSNMWAIGRPLSQSGHGMLLANPHLPWDGSTVFHEVHVTVPGTINVSGATFIGIPVVTIGFNESLGWSHTVNRVDSDDLYELTLDETRTKYAYEGGWLPLTPRTVSVEVKNGAGVERRDHVLWSSHYGPVRLRRGTTYALKSANLAAVEFLTQWNAMGKATSLETFADAVKMQQLPMFNIACADRAGNVWYVFNGRIPIRPAGYDWTGVVPGNTSKTEWFAVRPLGDLPQLWNPSSGYVQNANDAPWYTNLEQRIDPAPFAAYINGDGLGWRGQLSLRILSGERELTLDRLMRHKYNAEVPFADRSRRDLLELLGARGAQRTNTDWQEAARLLEAWNGRVDADSRGAAVFVAWWGIYAQLTAGKPFRTPWNRADALGTPAGLSDHDLAMDAFGRALATVKQRYGKLDVAWGETHRLRRGALDLPLGGMPNALRNVHYRLAPDGKFVAAAGDSYVLAVEFSEGSPRAYSVLPYSQSSNPRSPHFNDQASLYASQGFKPAWFSETDIAANLSQQYQPNR